MCLIKMREEDDDEVVATRVIKHTSSPPPLPVVPVVAPPSASFIEAGSVDSFSSEESRYRTARPAELPVVFAPADSIVPVHMDALPAPKYANSTSNEVIRQRQVETRRYASSARSARSSRHSLVDDGRGGGSVHGGSLYGGEGSVRGNYRYVSPSRGGGSEYDGEIRRSRSGRRIDYHDTKRRGSVSYVNPRETARSVRSSGGGRVSRERVVTVDRY